MPTCYISPTWGDASSNLIVTNFFMCGPSPDIIMSDFIFIASVVFGERPRKFSSPIDLIGDLYNSWIPTDLHCE